MLAGMRVTVVVPAPGRRHNRLPTLWGTDPAPALAGVAMSTAPLGMGVLHLRGAGAVRLAGYRPALTPHAPPEPPT